MNRELKMAVTLLLKHSQGPAPWQRMAPHQTNRQKDHLSPEGQTSCCVKCLSCQQIKRNECIWISLIQRKKLKSYFNLIIEEIYMYRYLKILLFWESTFT